MTKDITRDKSKLVHRLVFAVEMALLYLFVYLSVVTEDTKVAIEGTGEQSMKHNSVIFMAVVMAIALVFHISLMQSKSSLENKEGN